MSAKSATERPVRIAAAGDVHCDDANRDQIAESLAAIAGERGPDPVRGRSNHDRGARTGRGARVGLHAT